MRPAARRRGPTQHTCLAPLLTSFSNLKTSRASSHLSCRFAESTKLLPSRAMLMCVQDSPMSRLKRLLVQLSLRRWSVLTFCSTSLRARSGRSSSCTLCRQVKQLSTCLPAAGMNMQQACRRCKGYAASSEWLWQLVKLASGIKIFPRALCKRLHEQSTACIHLVDILYDCIAHDVQASAIPALSHSASETQVQQNVVRKQKI